MSPTDTKQHAVDEKQVSNGGEEAIETTLPYYATVRIIGVAPLLFHAWNIESIAEKAAAAKGSKAKKTDDIESYVYRDADGFLGIPGRVFHGALNTAGKFMQDPRSPRKSAMDLVKAGIIPLDIVAPLLPKTKKWDYEDKQRVTVQRAGLTRTRPAMKEGWEVEFKLIINLPEYITEGRLAKLVGDAGRFCGLCDYRPTYGRFQVKSLRTAQAE